MNLVLLCQNRIDARMEHIYWWFSLCKLESVDYGLANFDGLIEIKCVESFFKFIGKIESGNHFLMEADILVFRIGLPVDYFLKGISSYT